MTRSLGSARWIGVLSAWVICFAVPAMAQEFRGAITGRITDTSNAVLPGTTVSATHADTNQATTTVTNADGAYNLLFLTPGQYTVTAEIPGFKKLARPSVEVRVGDRLTLDLKLELGAVEETITVTAPRRCST